MICFFFLLPNQFLRHIRYFMFYEIAPPNFPRLLLYNANYPKPVDLYRLSLSAIFGIFYLRAMLDLD